MSLIGLLVMAGFGYMLFDLIRMANENHKKRQRGEK